jgi:hypothetical protein
VVEESARWNSDKLSVEIKLIGDRPAGIVAMDSPIVLEPDFRILNGRHVAADGRIRSMSTASAEPDCQSDAPSRLAHSDLTVYRSLPVFPGKQTCQAAAGMSQRCHEADQAKRCEGSGAIPPCQPSRVSV